MKVGFSLQFHGAFFFMMLLFGLFIYVERAFIRAFV